MKIQHSFFIIPILCLMFSSPLLGNRDSLQARNQYKKGITIYYEGDYAKAEKTLKKALASQVELYGEQHRSVAKTYYAISKAQRRQYNFSDAVRTVHKGLNIAQQLEKKDNDLITNCFNQLGHIYDNLYDSKKALHYFNKTLEYCKLIESEEATGGGHMNLGMVYTEMGLFRQAIHHFEQAHGLFKKSAEPSSSNFNRLYLNLGNLYRLQGDGDKTIEFAKKALDIKLKNYEDTHPSVAKYFGLVGEGYRLKKDYKVALPYFEKFVSLTEKAVGKKNVRTAEAYNALGTIYRDMEQHKKALRLFKKAATISDETLGVHHPKSTEDYQDIGELYEITGDYDNALAIYEQMLTRYQLSDYTPDYFVVSVLTSIAKVRGKIGNIQQALLDLNKGINLLTSDVETPNSHVRINPPIESVQAYADFLKLVRLKAVLLEKNYIKNQDIEDLQAALASSELAIEVIEKMRKSYQNESTRTYLNAETTPIYEKGVEQAYQLFEQTSNSAYLETAFRISEKSKASILWQNINEKYAFGAANIPDEVMDSIRLIHHRINDLEDALIEVETPKNQNQIQNQLFDLKRSYESHIASLEKFNTAYYQLKYATPKIDMSALQTNLADEKTALIQYFYTENNLYAFVLTQQGLQGFRQKKPKNLSQTVLALRHNNLHQNPNSYIQYLNQLHDLLIAPLPTDLTSIHRLIIIPHGVLNYLSFESLATAKPQATFKNLDYLLKEYNIQYAWSAALWANRPSSTATTTVGFAGFAPVFSDKTMAAMSPSDLNIFRNERQALPHTMEEIQAAQAFFPGKMYFQDEATESQFLDIAPKSKILHLATHGIVNDEFPIESGLAFMEKSDSLEDGFLNTLEIYELNLNAELAVMSACNTGFGKLLAGEGVISLGRAFLYAGCRSVMMSLWPANDKATSLILKGFYKESAAGLSKDEALRTAKLTYLEQADPLTAHPYLWANLTMIGDMKTLKERTFSPFLPYVLGLTLFIAIGGIFYFKTKKHPR